MKNKQIEDYLGRINLHKATEIEASPRPLKNTQRIRNNKISSKINENCWIIENKRIIDGIVPVMSTDIANIHNKMMKVFPQHRGNIARC